MKRNFIFLCSSSVSVGSMEDSSPVREESGCGAGIFHLSSSSTERNPGSPETSISNNDQEHFNKTVRLLVGSKHHFDLVKIHLGPNVTSDTMKILTLASGSSFGAISATEVSPIWLSFFIIENYDSWVTEQRLMVYYDPRKGSKKFITQTVPSKKY